MSEETQKPASGFPPIDVPADLQPIYSNLVRISHSPSEIVLDFSRVLPAQLSPHVLARILMSPVGAKMLLRALAENIARYETTFGEIKIPGDNSLANDLFGQIHPPEPPKPG